ncbi:hypothetical protein FRB97_001814 [Tulasnella sp. 331]|nr:hypothetical protein FRB97_001814 [Tulasnella sp. 331]KAG8876571.1 hypothetical protein FRB98_007240 [Tulasnella sp. 332]
MIAQRDDILSLSTRGGPAFMASRDQRTLRFLSCFAIFLLRMYESTIVLAWVKKLQRTTGSDDDDDDEVDTEKAALLHKWVASRHQSLIRTWTTQLQLSTSSTALTTTAAVNKTHPALSLAIPKMHGRTLTWEAAPGGESDEAEASTGSPTTSASIEAYSSDDDNEDDANDTDITEDTEIDPANCPTPTYTDTSLTLSETITENVTTEIPDDPPKQSSTFLPPTFHEDEDETETASDDLPFGPDALVILPSRCSSVPTIILSPPPTPSTDQFGVWDTAETPTQYSMCGNRLVVPGFRCYDDENVRPGTWQKWDEEGLVGVEEDVSDSDADMENTGTDDDSDVDDNERTWTYHWGSMEEELIKTKALVKPLCAPQIKDADVKKTFWIDEDEEDLPDLPSDWA